MPDLVIIKNNGLAQRSFRCRLHGSGGDRQDVRDGLMVVVPGANPDTKQPGISEPIPNEYLVAESNNEFLIRMFEEGIFVTEKVT